MTTKLGRIASWSLAVAGEDISLKGQLHKYRDLVLEVHAPLGALVTVTDHDGSLILGEVVGYQEFSVSVKGDVALLLESEHEVYWRTDDSRETAVDGQRLKTYRKPYIERVRDPVMERYFAHTQRTMQNMAQQQAEVLATLQKDMAAQSKRHAAELKKVTDATKPAKPVEGNKAAEPASGQPVVAPESAK